MEELQLSAFEPEVADTLGVVEMVVDCPVLILLASAG